MTDLSESILRLRKRVVAKFGSAFLNPRLKNFGVEDRMKMMLFAFCIFAITQAADAANEPNAKPQLSLLAGADGMPAQIELGKERAVVAGPCRLFLDSPQGLVPVPPLHERSPGNWTADWAEQRLQISVAYAKQPEANIVLTVKNLDSRAKMPRLQLLVPINSEADRFFSPAGSDPLVSLHAEKPALTYSYGRGGGIQLALPLGAIYSTKSDWGLAFLGDEHPPIPGLGLIVEPSKKEATIKLLFADLDIKSGDSVSRTIYFVPTAGDWRPALAAALSLFPFVFEPKNPAIADLVGPFVGGGGTPPDDRIADWYAQGTRVLQIHGTVPFYGLYVPDREPFIPFVDDQWHFLHGPRGTPREIDKRPRAVERLAKERLPQNLLPPEGSSWHTIRDFVETRKKPTMTKAAVNDYITRLHRKGIKALMYFNPTEAWGPWAAAEFPQDRSLTADGQTRPTWYESVQMVPDRNRPWGKYILDQMRGELKIYPEVDGIFFDQAAIGSHDLYELCAEGCREVRAQGKICWWNGPYNAELASLTDGLITELGGTQRYRPLTEIIQYYGIAGKPINSNGPITPEAYSEMLLHGAIPQPVGASERELGAAWFPLFQRLRNRRWVLTAHALEVDGGIAANIFQTPNGDYVIPLTPAEKGPTGGRSISDFEDVIAGGGASGPKSEAARSIADFDVKVRVADGTDVKTAILLTPDAPASRQLAFKRVGETIIARVPKLNPAGLLVLSK